MATPKSLADKEMMRYPGTVGANECRLTANCCSLLLIVLTPHTLLCVVDADYTDHAGEDASSGVATRCLRKTTTTGEPIATFPMILHELLERAEQRGYASIVRWQAHGRAFRIHKRHEFLEHVLPLYFDGQGAYTSFQRQLNSYGFLRLCADGPDQKAYYHELFLRGKAHLAIRMTRGCSSNSRVRRRWDPTTEPNLCALEPLPASSWRPESSLGPQREAVDSLHVSDAATLGNAQNERKRQKQEATLAPLSHHPYSFSNTHTTSDSDLAGPFDLQTLPQCASLDPPSSSQHSSCSSSNQSPISLADTVHQTHSGCPNNPPPGLYRLACAAGATKLHHDDQSLDHALLPRELRSTRTAASWTVTTTTRKRPSGQTTTRLLESNGAAQARPASLTESVNQHENIGHSATPSTGSFTYDRLFSDRLLRAEPAELTGYNSHASMQINCPAANVTLGSSQGSTMPMAEAHTLTCRHAPQTTLVGRAVHSLGASGMSVNATEPLPFQFHSGRVPSALSVRPANGGEGMHMLCQEHRHNPFSTMQEPRVSTTGRNDRALFSSSPACHDDQRQSTKAAHSNPPGRDETISHYLHLQHTKFDELTDDALGDVEETDALSACSCGSTIH
jgi:HSF-type DNA-binding